MALTAIVAFALAASLSAGAAASARPRTTLSSFTNALVRKLSAHYEVATGYPELYTNAYCTDTFADLDNCLANNPAAPYILPIVPTWPNEYSDPALANVFGPSRPGTSGIYRLDPREALVVFGTMPPPGRYMSLVTYVATRQGSIDTSSARYKAIAAASPQLVGTLFHTLPKNPERIESFSSIGDTINNVNIERQSGASFGTRRYFIVTPNQAMDRAVRGALMQMGVPSADIFTEPVSYAGMHLGLGARADDFVTAMRYALPNDPAAGNQWRTTLPLSVLAVREPPSSTQPIQLFPTSTYGARSGVSEAPYAGDFSTLLGAVCKHWAGCAKPIPFTDLGSPPILLKGSSCRQINMNCLADTQDTPYYFSGDLSLDHGEIYAVVDTLATETGNATYVSLGINDAARLLGVASVDDPVLKGSANSYAASVSNASKFFVYYVTRNCAGLEQLTGGKCVSVTTDMVPVGVDIKLSLRDYVRPGTARGPDPAKVLTPVVMQVTRPS